MREQRNQLGQAFGTKKARKAIASVTENAIGPMRGERGQASGRLDSGAAAVLESMADATADMATRDQLQEEADAAKPRPKANMKAETANEAYPIETLIGKDILPHIPTLDWITDMKNKKEIIVGSRFVASRIHAYAANKSVEKLKILRYLYVLLQFHMASKPTRGGRIIPKRDDMRKKLGGIPEPLVESVKRKFSDAGMITKFKVDLLTTHICALACWVDNFEVDMFELRQDLKLEQREMSQYFQEIGAKIGALPEATRTALGLEKAQAAQRKVAKLRIPLEFPKISFARK
jgi:DNA-directed RNA polymerase I subunit RPA49